MLASELKSTVLGKQFRALTTRLVKNYNKHMMNTLTEAHME